MLLYYCFRIAWFVARSGEWDDAVAMDPVSFNRVVVNQGDGWGAEVSNYFTVPVSGYHLIILSAGAKQGRRVDYRMYIDDVSYRVFHLKTEKYISLSFISHIVFQDISRNYQRAYMIQEN